MQPTNRFCPVEITPKRLGKPALDAWWRWMLGTKTEKFYSLLSNPVRWLALPKPPTVSACLARARKTLAPQTQAQSQFPADKSRVPRSVRSRSAPRSAPSLIAADAPWSARDSQKRPREYRRIQPPTHPPAPANPLHEKPKSRRSRKYRYKQTPR